jgi:hypothetical protein
MGECVQRDGGGGGYGGGDKMVIRVISVPTRPAKEPNFALPEPGRDDGLP